MRTKSGEIAVKIREERVFGKIGALLGAVLLTALCAEQASASLKRVVIVDRLDAGSLGLVDVEARKSRRKDGWREPQPGFKDGAQ